MKTNVAAAGVQSMEYRDTATWTPLPDCRQDLTEAFRQAIEWEQAQCNREHKMHSFALPDGLLVNHTVFGRRLRHLAEEAIQPLMFDRGYDHGFQDGGCLMFATALHRWSGGRLRLMAVYRRDRPPGQHVVAALDGKLFLDSDGMATEEELKYKMLREGVPWPYIDVYPRAGQTDRIPYDPDIVIALQGRLLQRFGPFNEDTILEGITVR